MKFAYVASLAVSFFLLLPLACGGSGDDPSGDGDGDTSGGRSGDGDGDASGGSSGDGDGDGTGGTTNASCENCTNGCCDGDTCVPFAIQTDDQCGADAEGCSACGFGTMCGDVGTCETDPDVCSPLTCDGCCNENTCIASDETNWDNCGSEGEACGTCDYGVVCDSLGACTDQIASDSLWFVHVIAAEVFTVNTSGGWDVDASAPEISVCLAIDDVEQECTGNVDPDSYETTFGAAGELTTLVTGQQLADGVVSLLMYDEDLDGDDFGGGWYITPTTVPVTNQILDQKTMNTTSGVKSITYSLM